MAKQVSFSLSSGENVFIKIVKKKSARKIRLKLYNDKEGKLVIPFYISYKLTLSFLAGKKEWIEKSIHYIRKEKEKGKIF